MIRSSGCRFAAAAIAAALHVFAAVVAQAEEPPSHTPPRLGLLEGEVSFWRPVLGEWREAPINLPLAPGDVLATGTRSRAELQLRPRVFVRIGSQSEVQVTSQTNTAIRLELHYGVLALDFRDGSKSIVPEFALGSITVEPLSSGFYRMELRDNRARVVTRNGARALVRTNGETRELGPSFELTVDAVSPQALLVRAAAEPDEWDRWNLARTDSLLQKAEYSPEAEELLGFRDLDRYGEWERIPDYGRVWFPPVPRIWAPYTTGQWLWDPLYGWTWVDATPWGWAPFHYGRWVWVGGRWGWTLGPVFARPVYAPALVVFFVGKSGFIGFATGTPVVAWAPLGWGEPCIPWWGPAWFVGRPWWGGWHGPHRWSHGRETFDPNHGSVWTHFEHVRERRGLSAAQFDRFGIVPVPSARLQNVEIERLALPASDFPPQPKPASPPTQRAEIPPRPDRVLSRAPRPSSWLSRGPELREPHRRSPASNPSVRDTNEEPTAAPFEPNLSEQQRPQRSTARWSRFAPPIRGGDGSVTEEEYRRSPHRVPSRREPIARDEVLPGAESEPTTSIPWPGVQQAPRAPQPEFRDTGALGRPARAWERRHQGNDSFRPGRFPEGTDGRIRSWSEAPASFGLPEHRPQRGISVGTGPREQLPALTGDGASDSPASPGKRRELRFRIERGPVHRSR